MIRKEMDGINNGFKVENRKYGYLRRGLYARQIKNILSLFPRENICVVKSSDLKNYPLESLNRIFHFLGVSGWTECNIEEHHQRAYSSSMSKEDRSLLLDLFREDILELEKLLGMDFSEWLEEQPSEKNKQDILS